MAFTNEPILFHWLMNAWFVRGEKMALSAQRHSARFNLLQLETGEKFLTDVAVMHSPPTPAAHHPLPHVKGRLRICSACIVFEPALDDVPLLRIPLGKVTCIEPVRASGWNVAAPGAGGSEARFRVHCSTLISMLDDRKPGPYTVARDMRALLRAR
jgi:hypothetical protein